MHLTVTCVPVLFFLDVAKAFDTVSHKLLLHKLYNYGFRGPFHTLLGNFFAGRSQQVSVGNFKSPRVGLKAGVPQGSILSPLLFNLYVNDIATRISTCKMFQYADDTLIISTHLDIHQAVQFLQHDVEQVMDWFSENLFSINASKTKLVFFKNPLKRVNLDTPVMLHGTKCVNCACPPLNCVDSVKYLGIHFDSDLS